MKSEERKPDDIDTSSSATNRSSSDCLKSNNRVARKTSFNGSTCGSDPISAETSDVVDPPAPRSIDDGDVTNDRENVVTNEMFGKMYLINRMLWDEHPKNFGDDGLSIVVKNDSGFNRSDVDVGMGSSASSWLQDKRAAATTTVKGKRKPQPTPRDHKKTVSRKTGWMGECGDSHLRRRSEYEKPVEGPSSSLPIGCGGDSGKYFVNFSAAAHTRQQRRQQIKDVYAEDDTRAPAVGARRSDYTARGHDPSSFINRKMRSIEITRTNKIIASKILNVRTTIPKTKL